MSKVISEKLASEVLGFEVTLIDDKYTSTTNKVRYVKNCGNDYYINTHELAHKCKEWAWNRGYLFQVRTGNTLSCIDIFDRENEELDFEKQTSERTEAEAIFKACQWILENKGSI